MKAIFYDRANGREVSSDQLMPCELVRTYVVCHSQGQTGRQPRDGELFNHDAVIGTLAYKSEKCPEFMNWDLHTNLVDLVFLRLE